jgi:pyrroline-5-carboxylate reductase
MTYAFLGAGKMATALIEGMLRAGLCAAEGITAACPEPELLEALKSSTGVRVTTSNREAAAACDVVLVCVKPGLVAEALSQAGDGLRGKLVVSIAAGVTLEKLRAAAAGSRVVRAMPNTPATVGFSATAFACGEGVTSADRGIVEGLFGAVGEVFAVDEDRLDAVTGLSGSGPAYFFMVVEALAAGGVSCGLPADLAMRLAVATLRGAAELAVAGGRNVTELREMVTSPGGTTAAALALLRERGVDVALGEAVAAAAARSKELSRG